jgi:transcriptional regulator with XRE-family HTH domain
MLRMQMGMTQHDLGKLLGVTFQQVQKYEKGLNRLSFANAMRLAKIFDSSLDQLGGFNSPPLGKAINVTAYRHALKMEAMSAEQMKLLTRFIQAMEQNKRA